MPDVAYQPLKEYVIRHGGVRLSMHGGVRDRLVEMAVEEFPIDAPDERKVEVLVARLRRRASDQYGSILAMLLIGVLVNLVSRVIVEWWKRNHSHKVLMYGWQRNAQKNPDVPPAVGEAET